ncbi:MAG: sigma-70 family RNA polymerase sigma factor [bacterium]|nr:sigma-70 family RNA polymerase sigma factor [bacterium]
MSDQFSPRVTRLLLAWNDGHPGALAELMPLVCDELRQMARRYVGRESANHLLQPTALVNEFFLRIQGRRKVNWQNRAHFFGFAAQTMRIILVDHARRQNRQKRGSGEAPIALGAELNQIAAATPSCETLLAVHEALEQLDASDARAAEIVKLRFFLGMTVEETAAALDLSPATIKREWQFARLWLFRILREGPNRADD